MVNRASTMCSHCTHLIRGIILGSCWTEKRLIENMIFSPFEDLGAGIKIYILLNHTFYVFLLGKEFQAASYHGHRIDMILIAKTNFLRSFWPKTMQKLQWEIFRGGWIFPIVSALVFTRLFTDITYDPIHSSNDTNLKSESHWTSSSNHYNDWVLQTDWYGESCLGRMIPIQIDDDDQSHNWSNQGLTKTLQLQLYRVFL